MRGSIINKKFCFITGLPRSGSTLLQTVLSQNEKLHAPPTSALSRLLLGNFLIVDKYAKEGLMRANRTDFMSSLMTEIPKLYYEGVTKDVIVEKDRLWGELIKDIVPYVTTQPVFIFLLRPILEICQSFAFTKKTNGDPLPTFGMLQSHDPIYDQIQNVAASLSVNNPNYFFVTYEQLTNNMEELIKIIYQKIDLDIYNHNLTNVQQVEQENDEPFGTSGLHQVRPKIAKRTYDFQLPRFIEERAKELDEALWHDYEQAKTIMPERFFCPSTL